MLSLRDVGKTAEFLKMCSQDPALGMYQNLSRAVCNDDNALFRSNKLVKACQAAHCVSDADPADVNVCNKAKVIGQKYFAFASDVSADGYNCSPKQEQSVNEPWSSARIRTTIVLIASILISIAISIITLMYLLQS